MTERAYKDDDFESSHQFGITMNDVMSKVLSSLLYKDKIGSPIREISANAYDAHIANGIEDVPFVIHLPNWINPYFLVRDFGKGLSDSYVRQNYTTYGDSGKRTVKSDTKEIVKTKAIGGLGLGSKAPLAYADSFTIISRHAGECRAYEIYKVDGIPRLSPRSVTTMGANEKTGLEVIIPVNPEDFLAFSTKAKEVYEFYPVTPIVHGANNAYSLAPAKRRLIMQGENYKIYTPTGYASSGKLRAIMGVVPYNINTKDVWADALTYANGNDRIIANLMRLEVDLFFEVNELGFGAGREELSYDAETIKRLKDRFKEIAREIVGDFQNAFIHCQNEYDARCKYKELFSDSTHFGHFLNNQYAIQIGSKTITSSHYDVNMTRFSDDAIMETFHKGKKTIYCKANATKLQKPRSWNHEEKYRLELSCVAPLYLGDIPRYNSRIGEAHSENETVYVFKSPNLDDIVLFQEILDGKPMPAVSTLPLPVSEPRAARAPEVLVIKKASVGNRKISINYDNWYDQVVDSDLPQGMYICINKGKAVYNNQREDETFSSWYSMALEAGVIDTTDVLYAIPATIQNKVKKFIDNEGITLLSFFDEIKLRVAFDIENTPDFYDVLRGNGIYSNFASYYRGACAGFVSISSLSTLLDHITFDGDFKEFGELFKSYVPSNISKYIKLYQLAQTVGLPVEEIDCEQNILTNMWNVLMTKYPLVQKLMSYAETEGTAEEIAKYIHMKDVVDSSEKPVIV